MPHHKKCSDCKRNFKVGIDIAPYYVDGSFTEWRCRPCADAKLAKKQKNLKKRNV